MRRKIVAGNWKMNKNLQEGIMLAEAIDNNMVNNDKPGVDVILCCPFIHLANISGALKSKSISVGAQNCSDKESGAYTGEISASMIKSTGAKYIIIGHSERRSYYGDTDELINSKIKQSLRNELKVIFCCGEVLSEREKGIHFDIVKQQIRKGLEGISEKEMEEIIIAYEPVWAIGTGVTASSDQAQEMHAYIRNLISELFSPDISQNTSILYGGSCKPTNSVELFSMDDVDGGLIGGASLKENDFCSIINTFPL